MPLDEAISFISRRYSTFIEKGENKDKPIAEVEKKDEIRNVDTLIKHVFKKNVLWVYDEYFIYIIGLYLVSV